MAVIPKDTPVPVRSDLADVIDTTWTRLGDPGTWLTGEQRVAVILETRNAVSCAFCARCEKALSPFTEKGEHDRLGRLSEPLVDVVHRLVNDPGRLTPAWYRRVLDAGAAEGEYVETAAIVADVLAVDTLHRGLGLPVPEPPAAQPGEPTRETPEGAATGAGWVPMVSVKGATGELADAWWPDGNRGFVPNVRRALSFVPAEAVAFMRVSSAMYLDTTALNMYTEGRAITRPQMELLAARTSALNECFY